MRIINLENGSLGRCYCLAIGGYVPGMFFHAAGETVVAIVVTHKVQKVALRRMHRRLQRRDSRISDGARWQSRKLVGVVWRIELQVGLVAGAAISSRPQSGAN